MLNALADLHEGPPGGCVLGNCLLDGGRNHPQRQWLAAPERVRGVPAEWCHPRTQVNGCWMGGRAVRSVRQPHLPSRRRRPRPGRTRRHHGPIAERPREQDGNPPHPGPTHHRPGSTVPCERRRLGLGWSADELLWPGPPMRCQAVRDAIAVTGTGHGRGHGVG